MSIVSCLLTLDSVGLKISQNNQRRDHHCGLSGYTILSLMAIKFAVGADVFAISLPEHQCWGALKRAASGKCISCAWPGSTLTVV
jgi:hypothetical protein